MSEDPKYATVTYYFDGSVVDERQMVIRQMGFTDRVYFSDAFFTLASVQLQYKDDDSTIDLVFECDGPAENIVRFAVNFDNVDWSRDFSLSLYFETVKDEDETDPSEETTPSDETKPSDETTPADDDAPSDESKDDSKVPETGDNSSMFLFMGLAMLGVFCAAGSAVALKKSR